MSDRSYAQELNDELRLLRTCRTRELNDFNQEEKHMKPVNFQLAGLVLLYLLSGTALAQSSCTLIVTNVLIPVNTSAANSDQSADITVNCTDPKNRGVNPPPENYYVTIGSGLMNRNLSRTFTPATLLPYQIYIDSTYTTVWSETSYPAKFVFDPTKGRDFFSTTLRYYFRIPSPAVETAGNYADTITVNLMLDGFGVRATTALTPAASIAAACRLSTPPGTLTLNYTSFSPTAVTSTTPFTINCTNTTPYTLALDTTTGVLVGLPYSLALSQSGSTGTGLNQSFSVTGTIASGLSGTCTLGNCSASAPRTLTVSY